LPQFDETSKHKKSSPMDIDLLLNPIDDDSQVQQVATTTRVHQTTREFIPTRFQDNKQAANQNYRINECIPDFNELQTRNRYYTPYIPARRHTYDSTPRTTIQNIVPRHTSSLGYVYDKPWISKNDVYAPRIPDNHFYTDYRVDGDNDTASFHHERSPSLTSNQTSFPMEKKPVMRRIQRTIKKRATKDQVAYMESVFSENKFPSTDEKGEIAVKLEMNPHAGTIEAYPLTCSFCMVSEQTTGGQGNAGQGQGIACRVLY